MNVRAEAPRPASQARARENEESLVPPHRAIRSTSTCLEGDMRGRSAAAAGVEPLRVAPRRDARRALLRLMRKP